MSVLTADSEENNTGMRSANARNDVYDNGKFYANFLTYILRNSRLNSAIFYLDGASSRIE